MSREGKMMVDDISYSNVLGHPWIVFDIHELNFHELLFDDHLPLMEQDGIWLVLTYITITTYPNRPNSSRPQIVGAPGPSTIN